MAVPTLLLGTHGPKPHGPDVGLGHELSDSRTELHTTRLQCFPDSEILQHRTAGNV
jgi:hypothetical protein